MLYSCTGREPCSGLWATVGLDATIPWPGPWRKDGIAFNQVPTETPHGETTDHVRAQEQCGKESKSITSSYKYSGWTKNVVE